MGVVDVGVLLPKLQRFVVFLIHGGPEFGLVEPPHFGEKLPRPLDGFLLEVVAEGPVAQHFEEGVVVAVATDHVQIVVLARDADALLRIGRALEIGGVVAAQQNGLELVHASVGEQQRGVVVGHDRRAGDETMVLGGEEVDERLTQDLRRDGLLELHRA
jgi:hypothetical protein